MAPLLVARAQVHVREALEVDGRRAVLLLVVWVRPRLRGRRGRCRRGLGRYRRGLSRGGGRLRRGGGLDRGGRVLTLRRGPPPVFEFADARLERGDLRAHLPHLFRLAAARGLPGRRGDTSALRLRPDRRALRGGRGREDDVHAVEAAREPDARARSEVEAEPDGVRALLDARAREGLPLRAQLRRADEGPGDFDRQAPALAPDRVVVERRVGRDGDARLRRRGQRRAQQHDALREGARRRGGDRAGRRVVESRRLPRRGLGRGRGRQEEQAQE